MASNRDPRKDYRINRRGRKVTSSSDRSARSKKASAPRPTSSSTRASTKGSSKRVTTGQGGSRARVRVKPTSTGLIGTRNTPATKSTYSGPPKTKGPTLSRISKQLAKAQTKQARVRGGVVGAGATALTAAVVKNQANLKQQRQDSKYNQGAAYRAQQKKLPKVKMPEAPKKTTAAQSFDKAFGKARKAGKKKFTWRGKTYTTKMAK